jgi:hypothetical protein
MSVPRYSLFAISIFLLLLSGCGLFSTRQADPPTTGRHPWEPPRAPSDVLANLTQAMSDRDAVNYLRSFNSNGFTFEADNVALANDPSLAGWSYDDESQHAQRLFNEGTLPRDSVIAAVFSNIVETTLGDSAEVRAQYTLAVGVALASAPHRMAGTGDFFMRLGSEGYWQIYRWRDSRTEGQSTWSDLKSAVR